MLAAAYHVQIERHEVGTEGLVALRFTRADAEQDHSRPLVFVLHGLLSRKERHLDLCLRLAQAGFAAVALDAPHHGDRSDEQTSSLYGDRTALAFLLTFADAVQGAVRDIQILADYFKATRYGLVGHSMGGYTAVHAAMADKRAAAVVNVSGAIEVDAASSPAVRMLVASSPQVASLLASANLAGRAGELYPRPVLLLHGDADETVPVAGARRLHQALQTAYAQTPDGVTLREFAGAGHEFRPEMADAAVQFLAQWLKPEKEQAS